ncbi:MAG: thioredoxin family protein [Rubripirellula sp.]|jgi:thioredoxin-like negative regulator of GroEL|nr:thioredoxin family protein [Planctomycetaceae bacterium]MDF1844177.1 thioredoxin family protein [Rubripirellula sp.]
MTISLILSLIFLGTSVSTLSTDEQVETQDYATAYKQSLEEQKPLMVVVGAPWCPACNVLKETTLKEMKKNGDFKAVALTMVNRDEQPELAKQLTNGETVIPQIIVYTPEQNGWKRRKLLGFQSSQPVRSLIRRALGKLGS